MGAQIFPHPSTCPNSMLEEERCHPILKKTFMLRNTYHFLNHTPSVKHVLEGEAYREPVDIGKNIGARIAVIKFDIHSIILRLETDPA